MGRIRSVHPSFFTDEAVVSCTPYARILYVGLWTDADDQGLIEWKPLQLKMRLLPGDAVEIGPLLAELEEAGLVKKFEVDGRLFGAIKDFRKYQRPKKPNAVHALPDELREFVSIDEENDPTSNLRRELCDDQDGRCFYCATDITHYSKRHNSLDIDHRLPRSRGGTDARDNLVAACRACNRGKSDRSEGEWLAILRARIPNRSASAGFAPQMEDGGGRREEVSEAIASSVAAGDCEDGFEALWMAYPHVKGRSSKPKSRLAWGRIAEATRRDLPAAAARFAADGVMPQNGPCALQRWLDDALWLDWLAGPEGPRPESRWSGPADVRAAFLAQLGEEWVGSYLDHCAWQDVPERALIPATRYAGSKLVREGRSVLAALGLSVLERAA